MLLRAPFLFDPIGSDPAHPPFALGTVVCFLFQLELFPWVDATGFFCFFMKPAIDACCVRYNRYFYFPVLWYIV